MERDLSQIQLSYFARVRLAMTFIVLIILGGSLIQLKLSVTLLHGLTKTSDIAEYGQRFETIKQLLPGGQIIPYRDDFSNQCKPFVLAQYAVAPAILAIEDSQCGHMSDNVEVRSLTADLLLENSHNANFEPYERRLFPEDQQIGSVSPNVVTNTSLVPGQQFILLKDSGRGVRLYAQAGK